MTSSDQFTVFMHRDLVDELDDGFSPFDGMQAIDDVFIGLPKAHRSQRSEKSKRQSSKFIRLYRARLEWYPLGFSYVQVGSKLHVVELFDYDAWHKSNPRARVPIVAAPLSDGSQS
jgi:hypothetical protein